MSLVQYSDSESGSDDEDTYDIKLPISHVSTDEPYGLLVTEEDMVIIRESPKDDDFLDEDSYIYKTEPLSPNHLQKIQDEMNQQEQESNNDRSVQNVHIIHTKVNNFTPPIDYELQFQDHLKPSPPPKSPTINNTTTRTTTTHTSSITKPIDISFLPPKPTQEPDLNLVEKILKYHNMKSQNIHLNTSLRNSIAFKNPSILDKLVEFCDIKELGSNFESTKYNPYRFSLNDCYEILDNNQRNADEKREFARRNKVSNTIEFVSSSSTANKPLSSLTTITSNNNNNKKKKNKEKYKYKNQIIPQQQQQQYKQVPAQPILKQQKGSTIISSAAILNKKRDIESTQSHIDSVSKRFRTNIN